MWKLFLSGIAALAATIAVLAPAAASPRQEAENGGQAKRPREAIFVKSYPISDITGQGKAGRLRKIATDPNASDAQACKALRELERLEESGSIAQASQEVADLMRQMLSPSFDPERQSLSVGDGAELVLSGNAMQHNSARLLLRSRRSDDRHVKIVLQVFKLPPAPLPPALRDAVSRGEPGKGYAYTSWLMERMRESGTALPDFERTVVGETCRPMEIGLTRRVPVVSDYRRIALVDSTETVLEPVVEEIVEGPVLNVLVGQFQGTQLVIKADVIHRTIRRPIPTRSLRFEKGEEVVIQVPTIDVARGSTGTHGVFGTTVWLGTSTPIPTEPRTDYIISLRVDRA